MNKLYSVGGLKLELPIIVGAGVCKVPEQVLAYQGAPIGAVAPGSFTMSFRDKNAGAINMWPERAENEQDLMYVNNSWGMPNCGIDDAVTRFNALDAGFTMPLILNFAGFTPKEFGAGYRKVISIPRAVAYECNLGCPNTTELSGGITMSYDLAGIEATLDSLGEAWVPYGQKIWLKFSPFHHPAHYYLLEQIAELINHFNSFGTPLVEAVVAINTLPNVSIQYGGKPLIDAGGGYGGLSGKMLKPLALENVRRWRKALRPETDVIGMGGITNGRDVIDFLKEGAAAVGLTSYPTLLGGAKGMEQLLLESEDLQDYLSSTQGA